MASNVTNNILTASAAGIGGLSTAFNGGRENVGTKTGNVIKTVGTAVPPPYGPIIQAVGDVTSMVSSNIGVSFNQANIDKVNNETAAINNTSFNASNMDDLANQVNSAFRGSDINTSDIGSAGWGGSGKSKLNDKVSSLRTARREALQHQNNQIKAAAASVNDDLKSSLLASSFDFGGSLNTHGASFPTGLLSINNGGSHEANPHEGVQMGIDPQGVPNLVEEGETIFNDYVFSNRLKVPEKLRKKYKLGGDITFAEASKKLAKESEERPNDPISQNGLNVFMNELSSSQEEVRIKKELAKQRRQARQLMSQLSPEEMQALAMQEQSMQQPMQPMQGEIPQETIPQEQLSPMMEQQFAHGGRIGKLFDGDGWDTQALINANKSYAAANTSGHLPYSRTMSDADIQAARANPSYAQWTQYAPTLADNHPYWEYLSKMTGRQVGDLKQNFASLRQGKWGYVSDTPTYTAPNQTEVAKINPTLPFDIDVKSLGTSSILPQGKPIDKKDTKINPTLPTEKPTKEGFDETYLRYVPALTNFAGIMQNTFSKPDYSRADAIADKASKAAQYDRISATPLGNYMKYTPMDRFAALNQLNAKSAASRRSLVSNAGGNKGLAAASLLSSDYNTGLEQGNLFKQAEEYNANQRKEVANFNRATDQYNSQSALEAAKANQAMRHQAQTLDYQGFLQSQQMKEAIDQQRAEALNANITAFSNSLAGIGQEAYNAKSIKNGTGYDPKYGNYNYTGMPVRRRNGGKLRKKGK